MRQRLLLHAGVWSICLLASLQMEESSLWDSSSSREEQAFFRANRQEVLVAEQEEVPADELPILKKAPWQRKVIVLGELAYFRPKKARFRAIYGSSLLNYRLSTQVQLYEGLFALFDANFLHKKGTALGGKERTDLTLVPVDFGLKYYIPGTDFGALYLKAAAEVTGTFIDNHTPLVEDIRCSAAGGVVGAGLFFSFGKRHSFSMDLFADYSFVSLHPFGKVGAEGEEIDIGGWIFGGGIGYKF